LLAKLVISLKLGTCVGKKWLFWFCEALVCVSGKKPNVPLVQWQKNKKMCVGQKLNLWISSLSARFFYPFGLGGIVRYHCCQRFAAWRSGGFLAQMFNRRTALEPTTKLSYEAPNPPLRQTAVSGWAFLSFVNNISCLVELADILHFHNCNTHNSRLAVVLKLFCNFHIRKNIGKRLSALFQPFCVRSLGK